MSSLQTWSSVLFVVWALALAACAPVYPGGLSEAEWNSLSPERRAELTLRQQEVDAARQANIERELDRAEQRREFEKNMEPKIEPSIRLSPEDTAAINALSNQN